jgi:5'-methylthioadenosine phosphorylase
MKERVSVGVIGGSGLYAMDGLENVREIEVSTPFGDPSDAIVIGDLNGTAVAFLPRHGRGHTLMPTEVPYQANIYALKLLGVQRLISVSACGSLREDLRPGDVVVPDQVFDFTKLRKSSFFGGGQVAHISTADPYCPDLSQRLVDAVAAADGHVHQGGAFIAIEGPRFSTKAESAVFRQWGMDIIGMTVCPEVFLAREAGICYSTMAHITDYDVWHESEKAVTVDMVIRQLNKNTNLAQEAIKRLIGRLDREGTSDNMACACNDALSAALITDPACVPEQTKNRLSALIAASDNAV